MGNSRKQIDVEDVISRAIERAVEAGRISSERTAKDAFKATERRLYALPILRQRLEDNRERLAELEKYGPRGRSKSITRFYKSGVRLTPDEIYDAIHADMVWDDIDNARGAVLDRYGLNFGVQRGGVNDVFYRLLIKVKMIALLSGGDIDTLINAAASLFNVDASEIELKELFPAKVWLYVDEGALDAERLEAAPLIAELMKRIAAAGVGTRVFLRTYHRARARSYYATKKLRPSTA